MQSLSRYRRIATWPIPKQSRVGRGVKIYVLLSVLTCALTITSGCRIFQTPKLDLRTSTLKPLTEDTSANDDTKKTLASGQPEESTTAGMKAKIRGQSPDSSVTNRYATSTASATELPGLPNQTRVAQEKQVQPLPFQAPPTPPANSGSSGSVLENPSYGYGSPAANGSPNTYQSTIAPGAVGNEAGDAIAPFATSDLNITAPEPAYQPRERIVPIDVFVQEARTGRIMVGGSVNSDLGVAGQLTISEQNFDIRRIPRSWEDLRNGRAFKGGGQNFRLELMPGNRVERYTVSWTERNLFGYLPYSVSVGGYYYTRQFRDWTEQKLGGRFALGYEVTKDLAASAEIRMEDVKLFDPRITGVSELDSALGSNDIYTARFRVARDTRDSPFLSSRGAYFEMVFDQVFGEYDYQRGRVNYSRYFTMRERPDGTGKHILAATWKLGFTGSQTPIFENFFAGGYSTLRGFSFRGAGPVVNDVQVGGEFMALGSLEYVFPLTADEMLRMVAFVDYGTIEENIELNSENFRVAPGLGLRVTVPALGPAPLAFDFAYPINHADSDDRQIFSFFMGFTRQ